MSIYSERVKLNKGKCHSSKTLKKKNFLLKITKFLSKPTTFFKKVVTFPDSCSIQVVNTCIVNYV